jgi:hypothetical protein
LKELEVAAAVLAALDPIPPDDQLGFLAGLLLGLLRRQGLSDEQIRAEFEWVASWPRDGAHAVLRCLLGLKTAPVWASEDRDPAVLTRICRASQELPAAERAQALVMHGIVEARSQGKTLEEVREMVLECLARCESVNAHALETIARAKISR